MLPTLCEICKVDKDNRDVIIPALIAWLFNTEDVSLSEINLSTKKKTVRKTIHEQKCRFFGERLNDVMELLNMSNIRLAKQINVDASHISRFRSGVRLPKPNTIISKLLSSALINRAIEQDRVTELAKLTSISFDILTDEESCVLALSSWLYGYIETDTSDIDRLLDCIDSFSPDNKISLPDVSIFTTDDILNSNKTEYWSMEGLREAVIRFLGNTVKNGGELWLYSDENIEWMVGDQAFFAKWFALMLACVKRGVKIKIIHNIDRGTDEMISAIQSWMPLYMSGMIESYICRKERDTRFSHTIFLRPESECIHASHIKGTESENWYDYLTDKQKIKSIEKEYISLIMQSESLVKIIFGNNDKLFEDKREGNMSSILSSLSLGTIPEELISSILERSNVSNETITRTKMFCEIQRQKVLETLLHNNIYEFSTLPSDEDLFAGKARINLSLSLCNTKLFYTPEEYSCHIQAISSLIDKSTSYHFYILPELPFNDIQIIKSNDQVIIIRSKEPYTAFVFTEPMMLHAFDDYFEGLKNRYKCDRSEVKRILKKFL